LGRFTGCRDGTETGWTWFIADADDEGPAGSASSLLTLRRVATALLLGFVLFVVWATALNHEGDAGGGHPTSSNGPAFQIRLAQWADLRAQWQFGDLNRNNSAYHEGEAVPFMLRIDNARLDADYVLAVRYDCVQRGINAYDFLADYERDRGTLPALDPDGPGSALPDTTISIPDDTSIGFDNAESPRQFKAWGIIFTSPPVGPAPSTVCTAQLGQKAEKSYELHFRALTDTVFILWGGHLASSLDWGQDKGAASISGAPYHMKLDVPGPGVGERDRSIHVVLPPVTSPTPTPTATATATPTPAATATPTPTPTATATATPTPAATATATPTPTPAPTATATPTPTSSATPTPAPTATPTPAPSATPTPTPTPSVLGVVGLPAGGEGGGPIWGMDGARSTALKSSVLALLALALGASAWYAAKRWLR